MAYFCTVRGSGDPVAIFIYVNVSDALLQDPDICSEHAKLAHKNEWRNRVRTLKSRVALFKHGQTIVLSNVSVSAKNVQWRWVREAATPTQATASTYHFTQLA